MNMNEYLKMLKRMDSIANTPNFKKALETRKKIEQIINPEWIKRTERIQNEFSRTDLISYVQQISQLQTAIKPIEFVDINQNFYNQIQSIQNKLSDSMPDLTKYYSDTEEVDDEVVETLQSDYSILVNELETFPKQRLTEEQRIEMIQKLETFLDDIQAPSDIASTELNDVVEENNREHEHDVYNQDDRENQQSETGRTNDGNPLYIFIQSTLSSLKDPKWHGEKVAESLVSNGYILLADLIFNAQSGQINIFALVATIKLLTFFFQKKK
ncbi:hypothetical protein ENLAB_14730 [Enterococcus innesii]|uniref:LXG domain-containing protein n=1 Tax=Enterococcus innesii TaxID=2839759 RepID=A0ABM7XS57_9ENTE|nr:hypothetical protein [Enterococcus innesii]BDG67909.1 hypothetical protein ENLAB_14730 [Enterococcus innesii]